MRLRTETRPEQALRQVLQTLAAERVAGLDGQRIERPEGLLGSAPEGTPADPCQLRGGRSERAAAQIPPSGATDLPGKGREPCRGDQRRQPDEDARQDDQ